MFDLKRIVYFTILLYYVVCVLGDHKICCVRKTLGQNNMLFHTSDGLPSTPLCELLWVNPYALF